MRIVTVTVTLLASCLMMGCGYQQAFRDNCRLGSTQMCDTLFGINQEERDEEQDARLSANEKEIESLSTQVNGLIMDLKQVEINLNQVNTMINLLNTMVLQNSTDLTAINQMLADLYSDVDDLEAKITYEQTRINSMQIDITNLQTQERVAEIIYPCGDRPNKFDESILRMNSGKLVAYFESGGNNRFLTVLTPGSYRTTDSAPYCYFSVNASGQLVSGSR